MTRTPVNLVTGFLGVGKTTLLLSLLEQKPPGEPWAVLVNEYGEVGLDAALIADGDHSGVTVREVAGGCLCCAGAAEFPVALHFLLREVSPARVLIEASGLAHPARLHDLLVRHYAARLEPRASLGLVTPRDLATPGMTHNPVFLEQAEFADVLVLTHADEATAADTEGFRAFAESLDPLKLLYAAAEFGRIDPAWLDLSRRDEVRPAGPPSESGVKGRSFAYPPGVAFDWPGLKAWLGGHPRLGRVKGIVRTAAGDWVAFNRGRRDSPLVAKLSSHRRDSRLTLFGQPGEAVEWPGVEAELLRLTTQI